MDDEPDFTCFGDFCILDEDCPWFEICCEYVASIDEEEEEQN